MADEQELLIDPEQEEAQRDLIDQLIDDLNDGVDYVTFDRDVLDTDRPDDWAAVELTGQDDSEWGDGHLIEQVLTVDIWVCVSDRGSQVKRDVQKVLKAFGRTYDTGWRLASRAYLYDLNKVLWRWTVTIYAPLAEDPEDDEESDEDDDLDELPFTDPEEDPDDTTDPEWPEMDTEE